MYTNMCYLRKHFIHAQINCRNADINEQVIQAMTHCQSLSLAPEKWRELIGHTPYAESFPQLMKIAVEVPSVLQEADRLISRAYGDTLSSQHCHAVLRKFHELSDWRQLNQEKASGSLYWVVPSLMENPADDRYADKLFPFALRFASIDRAITWLFCSTLMLVTLEAAIRLTQLQDAPNWVADTNLCAGSLQMDADKLARVLCQSLEYCCNTENGTFGPQATCSTQWTLLNYFRRRGLVRELHWCENIKNMKGPSLRCGIDLMAFGSAVP